MRRLTTAQAETQKQAAERGRRLAVSKSRVEALLLEREGLEAARAAEAESARAELEAIKQALAGQKAAAARVTATLRDEAERSRILRQLEQRATRRRERRFGARALRLIEAVGEKIGPEAGRVARERRLLAATDLFDPAWYRKTYKDVAESGVDPALHYLLRGNIEGRRPSAAFDGVKYYRDHPSVLAAGENPLIHHLRSGKQGKAGAKAADGVPQNRLLLPKRLAVRVLKSLRNAKFYLDRERYRTTRIIRKSGLFDEDWYLRTYPDVARNGRDPVQHYIEFGDAEQRDPSRTFNAKWYRETYPDVGDSGENTLVHHVKVGKALGRRTMPEAENLPWWLPLKEPRKATAAPAPAWPAEPPAIVVPVYNAAEHVPACLEAIRRNTDSPYRLIVIDDASPDPEIARILLNVRDWPEFEVRRNAENLGFTRTVNLGIALAGSADVVFLNSDTLVTPGWLRNLRHAAYSDPQVGTASPFSNNAGAFSVPEPVVANPLPEWMTLDEYGRAVTQASRRQYPRVPTTNGFCMYVRRACIDAVGPLDAAAFPRGYGEENDFCMRAGRKGWSHVIDDATLVYHVRSASFGAEKDPLILRGRQTLDARYPEYKKAISVFDHDRTIRTSRHRVAETIAATEARPGEVKPRGLYVVATRTGGTPQTNEDLMQALSDSVETLVLWSNAAQMSLQLYRNGKYVDLTTHRLKKPIKGFPHRSDEYDRVIAAWLAEYAVEYVHIRHIAWHSLGIVDAAKSAGIPVIFSFHDFYTICPTVKLLDEKNVYCGGTCTATAGRMRARALDRRRLPAAQASRHPRLEGELRHGPGEVRRLRHHDREHPGHADRQLSVPGDAPLRGHPARPGLRPLQHAGGGAQARRADPAAGAGQHLGGQGRQPPAADRRPGRSRGARNPRARQHRLPHPAEAAGQGARALCARRVRRQGARHPAPCRGRALDLARDLLPHADRDVGLRAAGHRLRHRRGGGPHRGVRRRLAGEGSRSGEPLPVHPEGAARGSRLRQPPCRRRPLAEGRGDRRLDPADGRALLQPLLVAAAGPVALRRPGRRRLPRRLRPGRQAGRRRMRRGGLPRRDAGARLRLDLRAGLGTHRQPAR